MPQSESRSYEDRKLLLIVAGCVVAGAAAIALVAGLASGRTEEGENRALAPSSRRGAPIARVVPAVHVQEVPPAVVAPAPSSGTPATPEPGAIGIDPSSDLIAEGNAAWSGRDFERAARYFGAEVAQRPERSWTQYMLGLSLWKSGDAAAAQKAMERALELNPASVKAAVNLSRVRNDMGAFESALAAADVAVAVEPTAAQGHFLRARSLYNLGRIDESVAAVETSLALDDTNGHAHNLLGLIRLEADDELRALDALERAAALAPEAPYVHNNLGMALERSGRTAEAVVEYRAAVGLDAADPRAGANLARTLPLAPSPAEPPAAGDVLRAAGAAEDATTRDDEPIAEEQAGEPAETQTAGGSGTTLE